MATLVDVVTAMQTRLESLTGIVGFPETPPENLALVQLPALLTYAIGPGHWSLGNATPPVGVIARTGFHVITTDLHIQRKDLALDFTTLMPYADSIPLLIFTGFRNDRFDGTVWSLGEAGGSPQVRYSMQELNWGGMETIGWRFETDVVVMER